MRVAANLADRYGNGELRTTNTQNLVIINIPNSRTGAVAQALEAAGLHVGASHFWRGAVARTGSGVFQLGLTETQAHTPRPGGEPGERPPRLRPPPRVHLARRPHH